MQFGFHGAAQTVTGSMHLLKVNGVTILIDCGLFQGKREETFLKNRNFAIDPTTIDHVVLTHAHIDHSGNIPNLVRKGFKGKIHCTLPTKELCEFMLRDSAYIHEKDVLFVNKIRAKQKKAPFKPIYTMQDVEKSLPLFVDYEYDEMFSLGKGIQVNFRDAGHILGSAGVLFEINENGKQYRVGYSGDIGRTNMPLMYDPNKLRDLDYLVMETTYGSRHHEPYDSVEDELSAIITEVAQNGGKLIIPAFAVGRTQLLVYIIHKLYDNHRIPDIPVFVDSPLGLHATEVFEHHLNQLDRETKRIYVNNNIDPFAYPRLKYINTVEESKNLNRITYPHIIISSSGMAEGGRILHHLRNNVSHKRATLLFVGYAARNTLARKLIDGEEKVKIFGIEHKVRCQIKMIDSFSAHADRKELLSYLDHCKPERMKKIFLVHGEPEQTADFSNAVRSKGFETYIPEEDEVITV